VEDVQIMNAEDAQFWLRQTAVSPAVAQPTFPLDIVLGDDQVRLLGYDLDDSQAYPGGQVTVTLYWQALAPFAENYQLFTHLFANEVLAQHDGAPECGLNPTTRWEPGQQIKDVRVLSLPETMPMGDVSLLVGMYNLLTLERLVQVETAVDAISLTTITIQEAKP